MQNDLPMRVSYLRAINQRRVLEAIENCRVTSRTELAHLLSMSKPAISDNLQRLLSLGLVEETSEGSASPNGGRRPVMLRFNENRKYVIAIDLNNSNPIFVMYNLRHEIIRELDIRVSKSADLNAHINVLENGIQMLMDSSARKREDILYITVAAPGVYNDDGELCGYNRVNPGAFWSQSDIKQTLEERFGIPVLVKNDIKAAALGEWSIDRDGDSRNMMYVGCGIGMGVGYILDGKLYEGHRFNAGEIYNYTDREKIRMGLTLEDAICMESLLQRVRRDMKKGVKSSLQEKKNPVEFEDIVAAHDAGDPYILNLIRDIADDICILILNFANMLCVDKVVFGGEYAAFSKTIFDQFEKVFKPLCHHPPELMLPKLGKYSGVMGMVCLAKERYFDEICSGE